METKAVIYTAVPDFPMIAPGDDLAALIDDAIRRAGMTIVAGDILVIAQKVVSKAEDRFVDLRDVTPSARAIDLAAAVDKDPRLVELILGESSAVLRDKPGVLIVEHRLGLVAANAAIDRSNVGAESDDRVLLLPRDPDRSCRTLRAALAGRFGIRVGVIMNDSIGRAWRLGTVGLAIGVAGPEPLIDLRGRTDLDGRELEVSEVAFADEVAAAASIVMGQADEATPIVVASGLDWRDSDAGAAALLRPHDEDLFR